MYTPRAEPMQHCSLSTPPSAALAAMSLTAQQAEDSIAYIQRELARLLRACEYREQHPYDATPTTKEDTCKSGGTAQPSTTPRGADGNDSTAAASSPMAAASQRCDSAPSLTASGQPPFKLAQSMISSASCTQHSPRTEALGAAASTTGGLKTGCGGDSAVETTRATSVTPTTTISGAGTTTAPSTAGPSANLGRASFSSFERRRIAHLLGRVALEIAGVWAYVQHLDRSQGGTPTPVSSLPTTALGTVRQSSDGSTAAPVISSTSPTPSSGADEAVVVDTRGGPQQLGMLWPPVLRRGVWGETARERCEAYEGDPAAQIAALGALIETATAIRLALATPQPEGTKAKTAGATAAPAAAPRSPFPEKTATARRSATPETPDRGAGRGSPALESSSLSNTLSATMEAAPAGSLTFGSPSFGVSRASLRDSLGDKLHGAVVGAAASFKPPPSSAPQTAGDEPGDAQWDERRGRADKVRSSAVPAAALSAEQGTVQSGAAPRHATRSPSPVVESARFAGSTTAASLAIPSYLRAYIVDDAAESRGSGDAPHTSTGGGGVAPRSVSDGSAASRRADPSTLTPATTPASAAPPPPDLSQSRTTATTKRSFTEPPVPSRTHAAALDLTNTSPTRAAPTAMAARAASAPIAIAAPGVAPSGPLVDVVSTSYGSSLPVQRATSASSLRSMSLVGSPVQAAQLSVPRFLQGFSGGSPSSQLNNASASQRSPDSAEMSPAAVAAYSRSASLLRRPHRLEVPVSRTHSLRRMPSLSSPASIGGASLTSTPGTAVANPATAAGVAHPPSTTASLLAAALHSTHGSASAPSYAPSKSASSLRAGSGAGAGVVAGGGMLRTSSYSASSPPLALGGSATTDSPHSSVAGMHFKRVISLDSEGGGWPQGSLADSLDMSQLKPGPLLGRPTTSATRATLSFSPPPQHQHQEPRTSGPHPGSGGGGSSSIAGAVASAGAYGALTSPRDLPSGSSMLSALGSGSLSLGQVRGTHASAPTVTGGGGGQARQDGLHSHNGSPNRILTGSPIVAVPSPGIYGSSALRTRSATAPATSASPPRDGLRGAVVVPPSAMPASCANTGTAVGKSVPTGGLGLAVEEELPPHSYRVEHEVLTEFLRCVHDLRRTSLTDAEFDSLQLRYFLPGVSLHAAPGEQGWPPQPPSPSAPPLPLFEGGDTVPLRREDLGTFCALVRERLVLVCHNLRIAAPPYLALL